MFLRDVMKRWQAGPVGAADGDGGLAAGCQAVPSLLEELAADPEDFVDLAAVFELDMTAVVATLVAERLQTATELVERLSAQRTSAAPTPVETVERLPEHSRAPEPAGPPYTWLSWGGGGKVGWGRWTRARGGARVHRDGSSTTVRPAMAAAQGGAS